MCNEQKKPHKHAELIKAWADGAMIQYRDPCKLEWKDANDPTWSTQCDYRIKPKEPVVRYTNIHHPDSVGLYVRCGKEKNSNIKLTFDPDTGELLSVEKI